MLVYSHNINWRHRYGCLRHLRDEPCNPTPKMQSLIDQFAHIASIAVERERAQGSLTQALEELKASEAQLVSTINTIPGLVWSATPAAEAWTL